MKRPPRSADASFAAVLGALFGALGAARRRAMLIGGLAVAVRGVERMTKDVDAAVEGPDTDIETLVARLASHEIEPRIPHAIAFAQQNLVLLLVHRPTGVPVDLSFAWAPFELEALGLATAHDLGGVQVPVARAEDLLIYKALARRPKDLDDLEKLLVLHGAAIDADRVRRIVAALCAELGDHEAETDLERAFAKTASLPRTTKRRRPEK